MSRGTPILKGEEQHHLHHGAAELAGRPLQRGMGLSIASYMSASSASSGHELASAHGVAVSSDSEKEGHEPAPADPPTRKRKSQVSKQKRSKMRQRLPDGRWVDKSNIGG